MYIDLCLMQLYLLHDLQSLGNRELRICLLLHLFHLHARGKLCECELPGLPVHLENALFSQLGSNSIRVWGVSSPDP